MPYTQIFKCDDCGFATKGSNAESEMKKHIEQGVPDAKFKEGDRVRYRGDPSTWIVDEGARLGHLKGKHIWRYNLRRWPDEHVMKPRKRGAPETKLERVERFLRDEGVLKLQ